MFLVFVSFLTHTVCFDVLLIIVKETEKAIGRCSFGIFASLLAGSQPN